MKNRFDKLLAVILLLLLGFQMIGAAKIKADEFAFNPKKMPVYKYVTIDDVVEDFKIEKKSAVKKYNNKYVLISGKYRKASKSNSFELCTSSRIKPQKYLNCKYDEDNKIDLTQYEELSDIAIYGKCEVTNMGIGNPTIVEVKKVIEVPKTKSYELYYTLDGKCIDKNMSSKKEFGTKVGSANGKYYIPQEWKSEEIEKSIEGEKVGYLDGKFYTLNKLDGSTQPEVLFVGYFDKTEAIPTDSIKKKTKNVMQAIVSNIEEASGNGNQKVGDPTTVKGNNGAEYKCFLGKYYVDDPYRVEYIFQEDEGEGIVVLIYFHHYQKSDHLSDVMLLAELIEIF